MKTVSGGSGRFEAMREIVLALALLILIPIGGPAQTLTPPLDLARREPIIDGQGAAGIRLGDPEETIIKKMGALPWKIEQFEGGSLRDLLYVAAGPQYEWGIVIGITFTSGQAGAEAIRILVGRRPPTVYQYLGHTSKGYRLGEPKGRLQALYGTPNEVISDPPGSEEFWWYRTAGLIIVPGEKTVVGETEAKLIVVKPDLTPHQVRRFIFRR